MSDLQLLLVGHTDQATIGYCPNQ